MCNVAFTLNINGQLGVATFEQYAVHVGNYNQA